MIDIGTTGSVPVTVENLELTFRDFQDTEIMRLPDGISHIGNEMNPSSWTSLGTNYTEFGSGFGFTGPVSPPVQMVLRPGPPTGLFFRALDPIVFNYQTVFSASAQGLPYLSDANVTVYSGAAVARDFTGVGIPVNLHMCNRQTIARMRPGALLINVSRGPVVDEAALIEALASGQVGGAALDVFVTQPLPPDHPYFNFDNVIVTPHMAGITEESMMRMGVGAAGEAIRVLSGALPENLRNPEIVERYRSRFPA